MGAVEQMELIPSAREKDIEAAVHMLQVEYHQWVATVKVLNRLNELSPDQQRKLSEYEVKIEVVKTTIEAILDNEARDIIKHRYLKSGRRKNTVAQYRSIMSESTIDRRIEKGLLSVANTLKDCGII